MKKRNLRLKISSMDSPFFFQTYQAEFIRSLEGIEVHGAEGELPLPEAYRLTTAWLQELQAAGRKIMIFGNGGSAGTASHLGVDFWKNGGIRCLTFNDASLLTCISNDFSYEDVFAVPVRNFADEGDLIIGISCSGNSENIVRGVQAGIEKGCRVITTTGFAPDNRLRQMGDLNFYVPSASYGLVETLHQWIIHAMLDAKLQVVDKLDVFQRNQPLG